MNALDIVSGLSGLATVLTLIFAAGRWVAKMEANTAATERLSDSFDSFSGDVRGTLVDHEKRIVVLESDRKE